jgi:hypothetical protein
VNKAPYNSMTLHISDVMTNPTNYIFPYKNTFFKDFFYFTKSLINTLVTFKESFYFTLHN